MPKVTAEDLALRIGKEGYKTPRDQYVYSRNRPPARVVALIWSLNPDVLYERMTRAAKKGDDWRLARREHLKAVSDGITDATRKQVAEESDDVIAVYRQCVSITVTRCQQLLVERQGTGENAKLVPILPKDLGAIARTLETCYSLEDRISGRKAVLDAHQKRLGENTWFVEIVKRHVRDPELLRAIGTELLIRKAIIDKRLDEDLVELNDLEAKDELASAAMKTSDDLEGREVVDVTPVKDGEEPPADGGAPRVKAIAGRKKPGRKPRE